MDGPVHQEFPFGAVTAANVLKNENVAFGNHVRVAAQHGAETLVRRGNAVRGAHKNNGERLGRFLGRINLSVQLDAVARRDHCFAFVEGVFVAGRLGLLRAHGGGEHDHAQQDSVRRERCVQMAWRLLARESGEMGMNGGKF